MAAWKRAIRSGKTHEEAIELADFAIRQTHGSMAITSRSAVQRMGGLMNWFTSVFSFYNHMYNRQLEMIWRAGWANDAAMAGDWATARAQAAPVVALAITYGVMPALMHALVEGKPDDEGWGHHLIKGTISNQFGMFPIMRDIGNAWLQGKDPQVGMLGTLWKPATDTVRDIANKTDPLSRQHRGKLIQDGTMLLGNLFGAPGSQPGRTGRFVHDVATGETPWPSSWNKWLDGVIKGRQSWGPEDRRR